MSFKTLKLYIFLLLGLVNYSIYSTTFIESSIPTRLEVSSGIIRGKFISATVKKSPTGRVVTEATFEVYETSGIEPNELINRNTFKVDYPGGEWNGMNYKVSGTPEFNSEEDIVLMVKKGKFGFILPDLALSKFTVNKIEGEEVLISSIFSQKEGIGKTSMKNFNKLVKERFGSGLAQFKSDRDIYVSKGHNPAVVGDVIENYKSTNRERLRKPSSLQDKGDDNISIMWFILALGFLGFISNYMLRGRQE